MRRVLFWVWSVLATTSTSNPLRPPHSFSETLSFQKATSIVSSPSPQKRSTGPCPGNTPENRHQWCDYDINTDYTTVIPDTGVVREFWLELGEIHVAPDGRMRWALAINGSIPGPIIELDWGDTAVIHYRNSLPRSVKNGTSMHFHGLRQYRTNPMDGVVSITQCPIGPGETMTYRWRATQYGTTWYHSHIGLQTWEGVFGAIIINGPASANYDEDQGVILLNDWDSHTVDQLWATAQLAGAPTMDNALINGTNVFGADSDDRQVGRRFQMSFVPGRSYRLRLGNAACDTHFKFSIDHHSLTVIANDLVPIRPYTTTVLDIAIGSALLVLAFQALDGRQRYDVLVHANQTIGNAFWLRAVPQLACSKNTNVDNIRGIVSYHDPSTPRSPTPALPSSTPWPTADACVDETPSDLRPIISPALDLDLTTPFHNESLPVGLTTTSRGLYRWTLNGTSLALNWTSPILSTLLAPGPSRSAALALPNADIWTLVLIETDLPAPHPVHLHGHDFLLVAQGTGAYVPPVAGLHYAPGTLPKRDTALLPAGGHLLLAFRTDNPGVWLLHCHIGWHLEQGFAVSFMEREAEVRTLLKETWSRERSAMGETCRAWEAYWGDEWSENGSGV
ncbi:hypothetical protein N7462_001855 [Penicillium macrosclerotiorum]|uniref:uncharacterized protein n=1 Tax=Penicillium macrosclerotiorum TaxID=303699 RepID=UPI002548BC83|nr:uncharacterized protein N7462_001855 [Penicillium macrosclerotiorum]KAJ5692432.1 hypothetical protein N7462_001855 [Penicillium macrosclerotiorum]